MVDTPRIPEKCYAELFSSAARLYRAAPWTVFNDEVGHLIPLADAKGALYAHATIIGQGDQSKGIVVRHLTRDPGEALEDAELAQISELRGHALVLYFVSASDMTDAQRAYIASANLELAGDDAYPWVAKLEGERQSNASAEEYYYLADAAAGVAGIVESMR